MNFDLFIINFKTLFTIFYVKIDVGKRITIYAVRFAIKKLSGMDSIVLGRSVRTALTQSNYCQSFSSILPSFLSA